MAENSNLSNVGYMKNIILLVKKGEETFKWKVSLSTFKNNEIQIDIEWVEDKRNNILFDSNVEIITIFNFSNINQDLLWLLLLIYGIKKYFPKSINLILPYFPYTTKDMIAEVRDEDSSNKKDLKISTDNWLLTMLQNSWISTIKTFDLWNLYVQNYSSIYIENITKDKIFETEFKFFKRTKKKITIILLNQDDYILFKQILGKKENLKLIYLDETLSSKTKNEQLNILNNISDTDKSNIYIFDKSLIRWTKIAQLINILCTELDIKELNLYITHGIFAKGSYNKFNTLMEKYPYLSINTTNSIFWYHKKLKSERDDGISILKLPLMPSKQKLKEESESEAEKE